MFTEIIISHEVILHDKLFSVGLLKPIPQLLRVSKAPALALEENAKLKNGWE